VSAATPSGAQSTLETKTDAGQTQYGVRINNLQWHEAPKLFGRGSHEQIFVARTGDDGKTTIEFGDGAMGARLPTGQDNVRATYRKGIGTDGLVKAGQLTSLLTRPLGLKSVTNPEAATGAQDRESLDDARTNAPLTVLTLDRTVSLQDYEDFSRAFAGVAKALATWTWDSQTKGVFITVAGVDGAEIKPESDTHKNLLAALQQAGDPFVRLRVKSFRPAHFRFAGKIKIKPDYQADSVVAEVEGALRTQFSFTLRAFGQPVFLSEVIAAVQAVPGVLAVDVDKLYRSSSAATLETRLLAALPEIGTDGALVGAELLTLDDAPLDALGVMS
jgi:predicted phage baseplate assembly protein